MASVLDQALDELYGESPADFTARRDALAKALKAGGDAAGAASVKGRRKPTQIAYVLNQLARKHADDVAELVDVGRDLARAQRKALRGEAGHDLRDAITRQRTVVTRVTGKTATLMKELGVAPEGHLDEIAAALQAALVDPAVGAQLEEGRLEKAPAAAAGFPGASADHADVDGDAKAEENADAKAKAKAHVHAKADAKAHGENDRAADARAKARAEADAEKEAEARREEERREKMRAKVTAAEREAAEKEDFAAEAEREADGYAAQAKKLAGEARSLAAEAKRLAAEAARVEREAKTARAAADRAAAEATRAAAAAKRARTAADRASEQVRGLEARA